MAERGAQKDGISDGIVLCRRGIRRNIQSFGSQFFGDRADSLREDSSKLGLS
jgi:hypothetical protein